MGKAHAMTPMARRRTNLVALATAALFSVALTACSSGQHQARDRSSAAAPTDLGSIDQLQAKFNQDEGMPRLILLLSPT
jgi:hypothetical protein